MSRYLGAKGHRTVRVQFPTPGLGSGIDVCGGAPRTISGVDLMGTGSQAARYEHEPPLRPVVGLAEGLPKKDLEQITVEAIRTHRRLRDEAEALEAPYAEDAKPNDCSTGTTRLAWVSAMMTMHAQQALLSTLLDVLGYVPEVPAEQPTARPVRST